MSLRAAGSSSIRIALNTWFIFHQFMDMNRDLLPRLAAEMNLILRRKKKVQFIINTFYTIARYQFSRKSRSIISYNKLQSPLITHDLDFYLRHFTGNF